MPFENLDKKILELIEQRSPAYDEKSWQKMEKLLDKHLPLGKNKRRGLWIFLFSVLLLGGGAAILLIENFSKNNKEVIINKKNSTESLKKNETEESTTPTFNLKTDPGQQNLNEPVPQNQPGTEKLKNNAALQNEKLSATESLTNQTSLKNKSKPVTSESGTIQQSIPDRKEVNSLNKNSVTENEKNVPPSTKNTTNENSQADILKKNSETKDTDKNIAEIKTVNKEENKTINSKPESNKATSKNKKGIFTNIIFSFSAGPDISKAGQSAAGEVKLAYGAGLGYRISNRFSIHSGFYVGRKVYSASPEDYNPPPNFWTYYPNLKHVDADCKVFEVPLNIYYDFNISKKQNWFVSAGLSSIFMKKEEYNYYFKPNNSTQYVYYSRTYENKNKHYFSILNLSGGYARKLSSTVSVKAEPYAKIALTGIGYGKVKLNSGGILFSAVVQPFGYDKKKNKKN